MERMDFRQVEHAEIEALREAHRALVGLRLVPPFHVRLAAEADAFVIEHEDKQVIGYALLVRRIHGGHTHATVVELHLKPGYEERLEDVLDLAKQEWHPVAYLARTDDCLLNATLLAGGFQVEPTALVLLPSAVASARPADAPRPGFSLRGLEMSDIQAVHALMTHMPSVPAAHEHGHAEASGGGRRDSDRNVNGDGDHGGRDPAAGPNDGSRSAEDDRLAQIEALAAEKRHWVVLEGDTPVGVIARTDGGAGEHELLDFAVAHGDPAGLAWALDQAADLIRKDGKRPAAVIDGAETLRRAIFRRAGFHYVFAYMVFYDPQAGRPSVATISAEQLLAVMQTNERFRLVDVMGEEHWKAAHLPGSEWMDFRGLAREAKRRFRPEEPIIVYCNGFG
jgi:hypothetical protein